MTSTDQPLTDRPPPSPLLRIEVTGTPDVVDVRLVGEMDLSTRGQLASALEQSDLSGATQVRLDMAGLDFCDASGLAELVAVRQALVAQQRELATFSAQPSVLRLLTISGLVGLLALLPS